jgi:hypothetical protein
VHPYKTGIVSPYALHLLTQPFPTCTSPGLAKLKGDRSLGLLSDVTRSLLGRRPFLPAGAGAGAGSASVVVEGASASSSNTARAIVCEQPNQESSTASEKKHAASYE